MSCSFRFYHLTQTGVEHALPLLLTKTLERGKRAWVRASSKERCALLNELLWTYDNGSFLPHGTEREGQSTDQPIWISADDICPNAASYEFVLDGIEPTKADTCEMTAVMFDARDADGLAAARSLWAKLKSEVGEAADLSYWQQQPDGGWAQKA